MSIYHERVGFPFAGLTLAHSCACPNPYQRRHNLNSLGNSNIRPHFSVQTRCARYNKQGTSVSSTNKTDRHDITDILLKVALSTMTPSII